MVGFFTFHHISHEDFELKIDTPRIRRRVPKKKLIVLRFSLQ